MRKLIDPTSLYENKHLNAKQKELQYLALNNFEAFIRLVAPFQLLSNCHIELCKWIQEHLDENKLVLWPRDHGKSRMSAFYTVWEVARDPSTTIIYASATAEKAEEQLRFIKDIITNTIMFRYFPGLIDPEEGKREAWNKTFIIVDHPRRKEEGVVDSTVMTCGLEKTITGKHCKRFVMDDIVVPENNTEQGRKDVNAWVAQATSILSAHSSILAVGTRYHPRDAYQMMIDMKAEMPALDEDGNEIFNDELLFLINMADVEADGDFLWPLAQRKDGAWFGFNDRILAKKKAVYEAAAAITQFYAQYYNDPNDKSTAPISRELFKYYDRKELRYTNGIWEIEYTPLHVYAALDLAATIADSSDYTVLTVGGIDPSGNRYLMEIRRFKTTKTSKILEELRSSYIKNYWKKLRIESVSGFRLVAEDLADKLYDGGIRIPIDYYIPPNTIAKAIRVNNIMEPLYQSGSIYHYRGGNAQVLEDELVSAQPLNDDTKDSWAMCNDLMVLPIQRRKGTHSNIVRFDQRFGGVAM